MESAKKRRIREDALGEVSEPSFPVPAIPGKPTIKKVIKETEQLNG
jgi:hypothetical protein